MFRTLLVIPPAYDRVFPPLGTPALVGFLKSKGIKVSQEDLNMPYYDYTFEKELELNVIRNVFETKLDRALGVRGEKVNNERIILQSQFSEQRHVQEDANQANIKEGFFRRLLGRK